MIIPPTQTEEKLKEILISTTIIVGSEIVRRVVKTIKEKAKAQNK